MGTSIFFSTYIITLYPKYVLSKRKVGVLEENRIRFENADECGSVGMG
jgi:hypothetical protein